MEINEYAKLTNQKQPTKPHCYICGKECFNYYCYEIRPDGFYFWFCSEACYKESYKRSDKK